MLNISIDSALEQRRKENNPVIVGLIGAGTMASHIAWQIINATPGMYLSVISNRTLEKARQVYQNAGIDDITVINKHEQLTELIQNRKYAITDNPYALTRSKSIDVIIEVTGNVEFASNVIFDAIENHKDIVTMNAELHGTIGPILKVYADRAGVIFSDADGDQPGAIMNLFRFVKLIGCKPVLAGNIKGLHDPYRTPATQKAFAEKHKQNVRMVTSFADGTKISFEMAIVANATGLRAGKRGMYGPECDDVSEAPKLFPMEQLMNGGIVDYLLGAKPSAGIFILGYSDTPIQQHFFKYLKMGDGPIYTFYKPFHLCSFEVPLTAARVAILRDAAITPVGKPICDVITVAKRDLQAGEILDGIGGFTCYGLLENADIVHKENLLPIGLSADCKLKYNIPKDQVITYDDVVLPDNRLSDKLRAEQNVYFTIKTK